MTERLADLRFADPTWLYAGALACVVLLALAALGSVRRRRALARFAAPLLARRMTESVGRGRRALKLALLVLALACACIALARPRLGYHTVVRERRGVDILFAVDTSRSMLATDLRPDRLTRAKLAVSDVVREFEGDRAGLVAFAGEAFLQCPMTLDREVFERALAELDTDIIPLGGTDVGAAIRESIAAFGDASHERLLVLLTDGESLEGDVLEAADEAQRAGVRVFTIGVGSAEGAFIPVPGPRGRPTLLRDDEGELVRSSLDEPMLREIAARTGGAYEPLGATGEGLARLYARHLASLPRHAIAAREERIPHEQFQWPLGLAIALMLIEPWIGERRAIRSRRAALAAAALTMIALVPHALASPEDARRAYDRGDFATAARLWAEAAAREGRADLRYDEGAAAYRARDWDRAAEAYAEAVRDGDPALQQRAYYDLGNAEYRRGQARLRSHRASTIEAWLRAIRAYESALALDADDADARHNLGLVRQRLTELREEASEQRHSVASNAPREPKPQPSDGSQRAAESQPGSRGATQAAGEPQGARDGSSSPDGAQPGSPSRGSQAQSGSQPGGQPQSQRGSESQGEAQGEAQAQRGSREDARGEAPSQEPEDAQRGSREGAQPERDAPSDSRSEDRARSESQPAPRGGSEPRERGAREHEGADGSADERGDAGERDERAEETGAQRDGAAGGEAQVVDRPTGFGARADRLSREQAVELLRSLRGEERRYPLTRREAGSSRAAPRRNW